MKLNVIHNIRCVIGKTDGNDDMSSYHSQFPQKAHLEPTSLLMSLTFLGCLSHLITWNLSCYVWMPRIQNFRIQLDLDPEMLDPERITDFGSGRIDYWDVLLPYFDELVDV